MDRSNRNVIVAVVVALVIAAIGYSVWSGSDSGGAPGNSIDAMLESYKPNCVQQLKASMPGIADDKVSTACDCIGGRIAEALRGKESDAAAFTAALNGPEFAAAMQACAAGLSQ